MKLINFNLATKNLQKLAGMKNHDPSVFHSYELFTCITRQDSIICTSLNLDPKQIYIMKKFDRTKSPRKYLGLQ